MNILVGYDGSNEAKDALKLAQKHSEAFGRELKVARLGRVEFRRVD